MPGYGVIRALSLTAYKIRILGNAIVRSFVFRIYDHSFLVHVMIHVRGMGIE